MEDNKNVSLDEVIQTQINNISAMDCGSEDRSKSIEELAKLNSIKTKQNEIERSAEIEEQKIIEAKKGRIGGWIKFGVGVAAYLGVCILGYKMDFDDEKYPTSDTLKNAVRKFPKIF